MSEHKTCWKPNCNRVVHPDDPDAIPVVSQCGECTRAIRRFNREQLGKGYITAKEEENEE